MKILYKQLEEDKNSSLTRLGVQDCYLKKLSLDRDQNSITKKAHHHTGFEMHIVIDGYQEYEINGTICKLERGDFLLIYPNVPHAAIHSTSCTQKYSITFNKQVDDCLDYFCGVLTRRMSDNITFISDEAALKKEISTTLIENSILEILVLAFRLSGIKENENTYKQDENAILSLAKQYIDDNIEMAPSVADVSEYCCLSTKQLTRIFNRFECVSPGEYIIKQRIKRIESLLVEDALTLKQVSERMHFSSEYYFNAFVKKYSGMPPGERRKMLGK